MKTALLFGSSGLVGGHLLRQLIENSEYSKIKIFNTQVSLESDQNHISKYEIFLKTLGFTYLNPHVYSDTVFILGNFSKKSSLV